MGCAQLMHSFIWSFFFFFFNISEFSDAYVALISFIQLGATMTGSLCLLSFITHCEQRTAGSDSVTSGVLP